MDRKLVSRKEFDSVIGLDAERRYRYFVKRVADSQTAWSLWDGSAWFVYRSSDGRQFLPLWPAKEYGDACAIDAWGAATTRPIAVDRLIGEFLPAMSAEGVFPAVFPTPSGEGIEIPADALQRDLEEELSEY